jgi:ankyrin repeat protein
LRSHRRDKVGEVKALTGEQVAALRRGYSHLINYEGDDPTAPIDPLTYRAADGDRLIHIAAFAGDSRTVEWLLDAGEGVNATGDLGQTPAHYAATNLHKLTFDLLMSRGADPTIADEFGHTPAMTWEFFASDLKGQRA